MDGNSLKDESCSFFVKCAQTFLKPVVLCFKLLCSCHLSLGTVSCLPGISVLVTSQPLVLGHLRDPASRSPLCPAAFSTNRELHFTLHTVDCLVFFKIKFVVDIQKWKHFHIKTWLFSFS